MQLQSLDEFNHSFFGTNLKTLISRQNKNLTTKTDRRRQPNQGFPREQAGAAETNAIITRSERRRKPNGKRRKRRRRRKENNGKEFFFFLNKKNYFPLLEFIIYYLFFIRMKK